MLIDTGALIELAAMETAFKSICTGYKVGDSSFIHVTATLLIATTRVWFVGMPKNNKAKISNISTAVVIDLFIFASSTLDQSG
jgi:hypothetical protein